MCHIDFSSWLEIPVMLTCYVDLVSRSVVLTSYLHLLCWCAMLFHEEKDEAITCYLDLSYWPVSLYHRSLILICYLYLLRWPVMLTCYVDLSPGICYLYLFSSSVIAICYVGLFVMLTCFLHLLSLLYWSVLLTCSVISERKGRGKHTLCRSRMLTSYSYLFCWPAMVS